MISPVPHKKVRFQPENESFSAKLHFYALRDRFQAEKIENLRTIGQFLE